MIRIFKLLLTLLCILSLSQCGSTRKSTTYNIGIDPSWYPLQLSGIEKNILAFSVELLVEIAKKENLQLAITNMNWDNLLWGLREKKYNAVLSPMRPYSFYLKTYSFSEPYLMTGPVLIVPKNSKIKNPDQLKGKEIGVVRGSSGALLLQTTPGILLQGYDTIPETLVALDDEQIEAAVVEILIAQDYVRNLYSDKLKIASVPLNQEGLRLISLFDQARRLMIGFDKGLAALKKSGEYEKLLKKWGLSPDGAPIANLEVEAEAFLRSIF